MRNDGGLQRLIEAAQINSIGRRDFLIRAAAFGVSAAAATSLYTRSAGAAVPKRGGHLIIGLDGASSGDSIDSVTWAANFMIASGFQFYNTLLELGDRGSVEPALVESWDSDKTAKVWNFKLRKGVTFHNGKEMTATDVIYSLNHHRGKDSKSPARPLFDQIDKLTSSDAHEFTVSLSGGNVDFPVLFTEFHIVIVPDGERFDKGIGTGAFVLENFQPGIRTLTKRNPNYWNAANRGWVDSVETLAINDPTARFSALQSGSIHIMDRVDNKVVDFALKNPELNVYDYASAAHYSFPMRCNTPPFSNKDVRLALKYGVDREQLLKVILRGHGKIGNDNPIPSFDPMFATALPQRPFDPDKAKFHMKKSGYDGPIALSISDGTFAGAVNAAELMQAAYAKAGITLNVIREPSDGYWDNVWMKKPFCGSYWFGRPTADLMLSTVYTSDAIWNESAWKRPDFDKLLIQARSELDVAKRKQMYYDLQAMVVDDSGELIPMFNNLIDAASKKVKGYVPFPSLEMSGMRAPEKVWLE